MLGIDDQPYDEVAMVKSKWAQTLVSEPNQNVEDVCAHFE